MLSTKQNKLTFMGGAKINITGFFILSLLQLSCNLGKETKRVALNEVVIGKQTWTLENLDVVQFRNGDTIQEVQSNEEWFDAGERGIPAWCHYANDTANGDRFSKLYNWHAVHDSRGLAPLGWHIPSNDEWNELIKQLNANKDAGNKMKSKIGWPSNGGGTNESGFSGLPGGHRFNFGKFFNLNEYGFWWSSTEDSESHAWSRGLSFGTHEVLSGVYLKGEGFSVRCVKD
jgi:uncharacterized protein (TIGR02145 family)